MNLFNFIEEYKIPNIICDQFLNYHKKNKGYMYAFTKSFSRLLRSIVRIIFYLITFNKKQRIIYTYRFLGLINSILLKKSYFRINLKDQ